MKRIACIILAMLTGFLSFAQDLSDDQKELLNKIKAEVNRLGIKEVSVDADIICFQKDSLDYYVSVENYGEMKNQRPYLIVMYSEIYYGTKDVVTKENLAYLLPELNKDLERVRLLLDEESLFVQSEMYSNSATVVGRMLADISDASAFILSEDFRHRVDKYYDEQAELEERLALESSIGNVQTLKVPSKRPEETGDSVSFNMVLVEGFKAPDGEVRDFWIGETEVIQKLWVAIMGNNPSYFNKNKKGDYPVENVPFEDIVKFIDAMNAYFYDKGYRFRVPAKEEWLYAAQGGNKSKGYTYSGSNRLSDVTSFYRYEVDEDGRSHLIEDGPRKVKSKKPNELDIYDMSGNVLEFCIEDFDEIGAYGGSIKLYDWKSNNFYKSDKSNRFKVKEDETYPFRAIRRNQSNPYFGFRLVMDKLDIESK